MMRKRLYVDFMGNKKWLFILSGVVLAIGIAAIIVRGLTFGIEFRGGTVIYLKDAQKVTTEQVRKALEAADLEGARNANIQPTDEGGYIVRLAEPDADRANAAFAEVVSALKLPVQEKDVTTIGPGWGRNITDKALLALMVSIIAILLYISVRFEYKMSVTAVVALVHDALIVLGIYALSGREITPNTFAALLTILGYSLYDTIVVFHRIRENTQRLVKQSFMRMANDSINQVLVRSINTSLTAIIPMATLFFFGGETLRDFAFALLVGLISGAYSSVAVASPIYAIWKETEPRYQALKKRYGSA
ncbi:MAG: protein translocase subunit SecF [Coriobacteriaceae bacterium]|nr:protein translocase subunit SecF [Coriobacteriaceae bacterium]